MPYDLTYMWNLVNKINKIETDSDTEKSLTAVRGEGLEGGMKQMKGLRKKKTIDTDIRVEITRGKRGWVQVEEGKWDKR